MGEASSERIRRRRGGFRPPRIQLVKFVQKTTLERGEVYPMKNFTRRYFLALALIAALPWAFPAQSQDKPANNMEILREKLKADKKLIVATNMELTESEAKNFWPVYDDYQKELQKINQRMVKLLNDYAADYKTNSVSDEKAKKLTDEYVSLQQAEANLTTSFVPKLNKALPPKKVARYLQIENKIRAVIKYDLASTVPLIE
jgi:hypothetical protein